MIRVHLFISGRVQGVAFRVSMWQKAKGVKGFVRNLDDGRVEAVLEGEKEKVDKIVEWAKKGPFFAKVTNFEIIEEEYKGEFKNFKILY